MAHENIIEMVDPQNERLLPGGGEGGAPLYLAKTGMCRPAGYGVLNRVFH